MNPILLSVQIQALQLHNQDVPKDPAWAHLRIASATVRTVLYMVLKSVPLDRCLESSSIFVLKVAGSVKNDREGTYMKNLLNGVRQELKIQMAL